MGQLTTAIKEFVSKSKLGFAATVCEDGTPNLSPKGTTIVWDENHLAFADIHSPGTVNNLLRNPAIEINVVDVFLRKGYRFKGTAKVLSEGSIFDAIISHYKNAGLMYPVKHIVLMKVEKLDPVFSPIYDTGATEEEVKAKYVDYWSALYPKQ